MVVWEVHLMGKLLYNYCDLVFTELVIDLLP